MAKAWYAFVRWLLKFVYFPSQGGITIIGTENIPSDGPVIIAPNHVSYMDPPAIAVACRRKVRFLGKEELFHTPVGPIVASLGAFPIKRGESDTEAVRKAIAMLENNEVLLVFPEGTRGDGVHFQSVNRGAAMLAKRTNAVVIPTGISGTNILMPRKDIGKGRRHHVTVEFGKGFRYSDMAVDGNEKKTRNHFAAELGRQIVELCRAHGYILKTGGTAEDPESAPPA